jgi:putative sugar O-methyltransferase
MQHSPNTIGPFEPIASSRPIAHDPELFNLLLRDVDRAPAIYQPTRYWRNLIRSKHSVLTTERVARMRSDFGIVSGFGGAARVEPDLPVAAWKRAVWRIAESLPVVRRIVADYRSAISSQFSIAQNATNGRAMLALDKIAEAHGELKISSNVKNGAAPDLVLWRGQHVPAEFVDYLLRVSDFYSQVPVRSIKSVIEVGPGLGWTTIAHLTLNPHLEYFANVDIPYTSYVSTQFLKSFDELDVIDYRQTAGLETIEPKRIGKGVTVYQLAPWQVPKLRGSFALLANAFSFYEMELDVCANYARILMPLIETAVLLHSSRTGKAMAHGPAKAISLDYLCGLFAERFPHRTMLEHGWNECYGRYSTAVALLTR